MFFLAVLLLFGGFYRFYNLKWDFDHSFHPDERNILGQTAAIQAAEGYRVRFFAYGQLPVFLYRATGELLSVPQGVAKLWHPGGRVEPALQNAWVFFVAALFFGVGWLLTRKKWGGISGAAVLVAFVFSVLMHHYPVFVIWFQNLSGARLSVGAFLFFTAAVGLGLYGYQSVTKKKWADFPWETLIAVTVLVGIGGVVFSSTLARLVGLLAFLCVVLLAGGFWAWRSVWGRATLGILALWSFLAALPNGHPHWTDYGSVKVIGRFWAALFSTATIPMVYILVRRVYGRVFWALSAAAFFAFTAASIQVAHYCITESFLAFAGVVVAFLAYRLAEQGTLSAYLTAGAVFGLALCAKTSSLYYLMFLIVAHLWFLSRFSQSQWQSRLRVLRRWNGFLNAGAVLVVLSAVFSFLLVGWKFKGVFEDLFRSEPWKAHVLWGGVLAFSGGAAILSGFWGFMHFPVLKAQVPQWGKAALGLLTAFFIFCLGSPWSLLDWAGFMQSMNYEWRVVAHADAAYVLQFKDTPRYLFHLKNLCSVELGWPLGLAAILGMSGVLWRVMKGALFWGKRREGVFPVPLTKNRSFTWNPAELLLFSWFAAYFGFIGMWNTKFIRYIIPLLPFFCIWAAVGIGKTIAFFENKKHWGVYIAKTVWGIVLGWSFFYATAYLSIYREYHPWIKASKWIYENVPPGSVILKEHWDDGLPVPMDTKNFPFLDRSRSPGEYGEITVTVYELHGYPTDDTSIKKNYYASVLNQGDYLSIASKKLWYTLTHSSSVFKPNGFNRYPVTSRYYRLLWTGLLGYEMVGDFHTFPRLLGWSHPDDDAEESFSVYDHPRAYLFKKVRTVPQETIVRLLSTEAFVEGVDREAMRQVTADAYQAFKEKHWERLRKKGLLTENGDFIFPEEKENQLQTSVSASVTESIGGSLDGKSFRWEKKLFSLHQAASSPVVEKEFVFPKHPTETLGYQLRSWFSWVGLWILLGIFAFPLTWKLLGRVFGPYCYGLSKILGALLFGWSVWWLGHHERWFSSLSCWIVLIFFFCLSAWAFHRDWGGCREAFSRFRGSFFRQEWVFLGAFVIFTIVRMHNPHIHDPVGEGYSGGGEAGMDFGFLSSIVRGDRFPPQNMWMAGYPIGYTFYFGHLLMGVFTKTLGLVPAVTYNLGIITLFALIFSGAFAIAAGITGRAASGWVAGFLAAAAGNLEGAWQIFRVIAQAFRDGNWDRVFHHTYDYWGPSRIIPHSINEFPYFSVLFADLHAHTLAMPFALFLMALILSFWGREKKEPFSLGGETLAVGVLAFFFGALAFLNTWELPTWILFLAVVEMIRRFSWFPVSVLQRGAARLGAALGGMMLFLGWIGLAHPSQHPLAVGQNVKILGGALCLGWFFGAGLCWVTPALRLFAKHCFGLVLFVGLVLALGFGVFWLPFTLQFEPQQNEVLWVWPKLRTSLADYFTWWGCFLSVALSALFFFGRKFSGAAWFLEKKKKVSLSTMLKNLPFAMRFSGMLAMLSFLFLLVASWVKWTEPREKIVYALLLATLMFLSAAGAIFKKSKTMVLLCAFLSALWGLLAGVGFFSFGYGGGFTMRFSLFAWIWFSAFLCFGFSMLQKRHSTLNVGFLLFGLFFLLTGLLEVFAMKEFLGGEWMRNNSLFKFGINAWEIAAIASGVVLPAVFREARLWLSEKKREKFFERKRLLGLAILFAFFFWKSIFWEFDRLLEKEEAVVGLGALLTMGLFYGISRGMKKRHWLLAGAGAFLVVFFLLSPAVFPAPLRNEIGVLQSLGVKIVFPLTLAFFWVGGMAFWWWHKPGCGRKVLTAAVFSWVIFLFSCSTVYPILATWRKCHGFLPESRARRLGYAETPTLNGLAYLKYANQADAAAIYFLNDKVFGQPVLVEAVGLGYNSWGSRYSIFTGLPAVMGWDGHVNEWVGRRLGYEIQSRFQAVERIYNSRNWRETEELLKKYGVSLVVVGPLEKGEADARKRYDSIGIEKFEQHLPVLYRNPKVTIYYHPVEQGGA